MDVATALTLVTLMTLDGRAVRVNPRHVVTLTPRREGTDNKFVNPEVHCVVGLLDGKFISVREDCNKISTILIEARK